MLMDSDSIKAPAATETMPHAALRALCAERKAGGAVRLGKKGQRMKSVVTVQKQVLPVANRYFLSFALPIMHPGVYNSVYRSQV